MCLAYGGWCHGHEGLPPRCTLRKGVQFDRDIQDISSTLLPAEAPEALAPPLTTKPTAFGPHSTFRGGEGGYVANPPRGGCREGGVHIPPRLEGDAGRLARRHRAARHAQRAWFDRVCRSGRNETSGATIGC